MPLPSCVQSGEGEDAEDGLLPDAGVCVDQDDWRMSATKRLPTTKNPHRKI
jgi:hypothetical protein